MNKRARALVNRMDALVAPELEQTRPARSGHGAPQNAPAGLSIRNASADTAELEIYGVIGGGMWSDGISAGDVNALLKDVSAPNLHVRINSGGGDYFQGVAIHTALARHPATVTAFVDGMAASAASVIMLAGDVVEIAPGAMVMIHDAMTGPYGNAATLRREADLLDKVSEVIAELYADRAGEDAAHWRNLMTVNGEDGTWFTADEAVECGLADRVTEARDAEMVARNLRTWVAHLPENMRAEILQENPELSGDEPEDADTVEQSEPEAGDTPEDVPDDLSDFAFAMRMWAWRQDVTNCRTAA